MKRATIIYWLSPIIFLPILIYIFPSFWIVPVVNIKFNQRDYSGLYIDFDTTKEISFLNREELTDVNFKYIKIHNMEFMFFNTDDTKIEDIQNDRKWIKISDGSKVLLVMGDMPSTMRSLKEDGSIMISSTGGGVVNTNKEFMHEVLNATPNDFHIFMRDAYVRFTLLNLKISVVPRNAKNGYILKGGISGFQAGDPSNGDEIVFIHVIDSHDDWYQLVFSGFSSEEIDYQLSSIRDLGV